MVMTKYKLFVIAICLAATTAMAATTAKITTIPNIVTLPPNAKIPISVGDGKSWTATPTQIIAPYRAYSTAVRSRWSSYATTAAVSSKVNIIVFTTYTSSVKSRLSATTAPPIVVSPTQPANAAQGTIWVDTTGL